MESFREDGRDSRLRLQRLGVRGWKLHEQGMDQQMIPFQNASSMRSHDDLHVLLFLKDLRQPFRRCRNGVGSAWSSIIGQWFSLKNDEILRVAGQQGGLKQTGQAANEQQQSPGGIRWLHFVGMGLV